jgi:hypothetical protein
MVKRSWSSSTPSGIVVSTLQNLLVPPHHVHVGERGATVPVVPVLVVVGYSFSLVIRIIDSLVLLREREATWQQQT